jgi:hypothetical protein
VVLAGADPAVDPCVRFPDEKQRLLNVAHPFPTHTCRKQSPIFCGSTKLTNDQPIARSLGPHRDESCSRRPVFVMNKLLLIQFAYTFSCYQRYTPRLVPCVSTIGQHPTLTAIVTRTQCLESRFHQYRVSSIDLHDMPTSIFHRHHRKFTTRQTSPGVVPDCRPFRSKVDRGRSGRERCRGLFRVV